MQRLWQAWLNSCSGFRLAWRDEAAFRQEIGVGVILLPLSLVLARTVSEWLALVGTYVLVLIVELLNTGIEAAIDRVGPEFHPESKKAKDVGSAAVLLALFVFVAVWGGQIAQRIWAG